jgi:hypothetical protein
VQVLTASVTAKLSQFPDTSRSSIIHQTKGKPNMPSTTNPPKSIPESTTLYYCEGSSDKIYQASIEPKEDAFVVTFAFGRRGSTLNTGTKTQAPVD